MSNHIDFYFDIISAYSYIAHKKIQKIQKDNNIKFNYKPIFLGGLHNLAGISAPAFNKYKIKNMQNDCELVSKKNDISFTWNSKFPINSLYLMRGYLYVSDNKKNDYLNTFFEAYWKDNLDLSNDLEISQLLKTLDIDNKKMDIDNAKYGTIGLESFFGALLNIFNLEKTIKILTSGKSRFGIKDYTIEEGSNSNMSLFTIDKQYVFSKSDILSKSKNSAFLGTKMKGRPIGIIAKEKFLIND